ncbi:MAG: NAD(P)-binding protein, partial [Candidatus Heimdallarchaeota archaeon]
MVSEEMTSDVSIIGAGPAGSCAAWETMRMNSNLSVSIFEEHHQIGKPQHCSGLLAIEGLQKLGVEIGKIKQKLAHNTVQRAKFVSPSHYSFGI